MTFTNKSFEKMLEEIGFEKYIKDDRISPKRNPDRFSKCPYSEKTLSASPEYREDILTAMRLSDYDRGLAEVILREVFKNMHEHGNKCNDDNWYCEDEYTREYRDYYCDVGECQYTVTQTEDCPPENPRCCEGECIPEFATIAIPVVAILGLLFLTSRRKQKS